MAVYKTLTSVGVLGKVVFRIPYPQFLEVLISRHENLQHSSGQRTLAIAPVIFLTPNYGSIICGDLLHFIGFSM